jgi:phage baseplate assembly protein gpV
MNKVNINGRTYTAPDGCSVSVINNKVYFNGKLAENFNDWKEKNIEIKIEGNCAEVKADAGNINIKGNVEGNVNADAGNISIEGDVKGNVTADCGNISANHISGSVSTDCGNIGSNNFISRIISKYL